MRFRTQIHRTSAAKLYLKNLLEKLNLPIEAGSCLPGWFQAEYGRFLIDVTRQGKF
jgi:hypothetical protein